jgi:hypothetical protein
LTLNPQRLFAVHEGESRMDESHDKSIVSSSQESVERKTWEKPRLRILPVPTKTQGGVGNINDQDDIFYKKS